MSTIDRLRRMTVSVREAKGLRRVLSMLARPNKQVILRESRRPKDLRGTETPSTTSQILRFAQDDGLAPSEKIYKTQNESLLVELKRFYERLELGFVLGYGVVGADEAEEPDRVGVGELGVGDDLAEARRAVGFGAGKITHQARALGEGDLLRRVGVGVGGGGEMHLVAPA